VGDNRRAFVAQPPQCCQIEPANGCPVPGML